MDILNKHELFEIEVLEMLQKAKFLDPLVFGGGTMLRLCYEMNRYSTDLDFWFIKKRDERTYFKKLKMFLSQMYDVMDAAVKRHTLILEIRSQTYPKRLKIEIRRGTHKCDFQEKIAFSVFSTKQVMLKAHTLEQTMENKILAALDRKSIRDYFDIEFLLRRGVSINIDANRAGALRNVIHGFRDKQFKVELGSILEPKIRQYYVVNKFDFLLTRLAQNDNYTGRRPE